MRVHEIEPGRDTLHGAFYRELPPALSVDPGDTVVFRTLDAGWGLEPARGPGGGHRAYFEDFRPEWRGDGHALCGPIEVRGGEPGMALEVRIGEIRTDTWGWTYAGGSYHDLNRRLGLADRVEQLRWELDPDALVGRNQYGHIAALRPFMGILGMPPDEPGQHSTRPPRVTGGNIDCKELLSGSSLYLPIAVPGALFSVGDGHAAQGDGEVCSEAMECPMERVELTFRLHPDLHLRTPRAITPAGWITLGFGRDLDEAAESALDSMLDLMGQLLGVDRYRAMALASVAVDVRVTQVVNGTLGVHAVLPHRAIR